MATTSAPTSGGASQPGGADVALVADREHAGHQQRRADDLIDEAAGDRQERLRIGGEDAGRAAVALHLPHAAVERRERLAIGEEHDRRRRRTRRRSAPRRRRAPCAQGKPARTASASVTAGLRCAPETPAAV